MADEAAAAAAAATIGEEALLPAVVAPVEEEEVPVVPVVAQAEAAEPAAPATKKRPELTAERRLVENKKRCDRRSALAARKKDAVVAEERQRAAAQQAVAVAEAKAAAIQEHAMLIYGHNALAQSYATGAGTASAGSSGSSVSRPLPPRSTAPSTAPFGYPPVPYEPMMAGRFLYPPRDGSPEVGESMTGPSPSSIDLNRAPAMHSKAPKPMPAAALGGARALLDEMSAEFVPPSVRTTATMQAPPSYPPSMPTTMAPPSTHPAPAAVAIDLEDNIVHGGSMNIDDEPLFVDELTQAAAAQARTRRVSKRTSNYTELEDKMIVEAWLAIGQDPLKGAEQKGGAFWRRIFDYFHEHRRYGENRFDSDRNELSIQKRWGTIQAECNKFQGAYDHVKRLPVSGIGVKDLV